jgi:hypothetical protein
MTITLEGKTFPVRASMRAWKNFEKATGCKVTGIDADDVTKMPELLFYFVQEGCLKQGMQFKMDVDEFLGMIEITDLPGLVAVVGEAMGGQQEKKTQVETESHALSNGTK